MTDTTRIDARLARRAFARAAAQYDASAVLQREVQQRLLERLELLAIQPRVILDAGCGTGRGTHLLAQYYRKARLIALDWAEPMTAATRHRQTWRRRWETVCADAQALPLPEASIDLAHSNLMLQWCEDLPRVFAQFRRVLKPHSALLFSTFGPDTLHELRAAWEAVDGYSHVNRFVDMHDIGDALVQNGFAEPVMDVEHITLTYADSLDLMRDLKAIGAHNVTAGRNHGLTGKARLQAFRDAYEPFRRNGTLPATYEVVYGMAWTPGAIPGVRVK